MKQTIESSEDSKQEESEQYVEASGRRKDWYFRWVLTPTNLKEAVYGGLLNFGFLPLAIVVMLYLIRSAARLIGIPWHAVFVGRVRLIAAVVSGIAYAHFMLVSSLAHLAQSRDRLESGRIKFARKITYSLFVTVCVTVFSVYIYPHLSPSYGAGLPDTVSMCIDTKAISGLWKIAVKGNAAECSYIEGLLLIDRTPDAVVFCKSLQSDAKCIAVPNSAIISTSWRY